MPPLPIVTPGWSAEWQRSWDLVEQRLVPDREWLISGFAALATSQFTAALDAGVPLRDVQIAARHSDPRTTTRYDRARNKLDRHASYIVTAFVAGAS